MTTRQLLKELSNQGIQLWTEDGKLRYRAPKGAVTPAVRNDLTAHKSELIALLEEEFAAPPKTSPALVIDPGARYEPFPLTDLQQAYALGTSPHFDLGEVSAHFYVEFAVQNLDLERLNQSWQRLAERHEMLRTVILPEGQQQILEMVPPFAAKVIDLQDFDAQQQQSQIESRRQEMKDNGPSIDQWPLFEVEVQRLDAVRSQLQISISLIVCDALSGSLIFQELYGFYQNPQATLPPLELSFRDYALALHRHRESPAYQKARDYWWQRLSEIHPAPELPLAKKTSNLGKPVFTRWQGRLAPARWQQLKDRISQLGLTPAAAICAAYASVLTNWSKKQQLTVNILYFNREPIHPQVYNVIGNCSSTILLTVDHRQPETFAEHAKHLQQQLWSDLEHSAFSGVAVLGELNRRQGGTSRAAMPCTFASALGLGNRDTQTNETGQQDWQVVCNGLLQTPFVLLDHQIVEENGELILNWDAVDEAFLPELMQEMFDTYMALLENLAQSEESWHHPPVLIPAAQREQRDAINTTAGDLPTERLHDLFSAQVSQRAHQPAVIAPAQTLTYGALDQASNVIAQQLRQQGAQPNQLVAVVMEKGWEQIVAVLGILKAGAAYLPIDPALPQERLWFLLENAEVSVVLTQPAVNEALTWPEAVTRLSVDEQTLAAEPTAALPNSPQQLTDLAYVIYTSGSTGTPKGVMIDHQGAVNTVLDINRRFQVTSQDRVFAISSLSFDLSVYDIFGTLAAGATLIVPDTKKTRDPGHWLDLMTRMQVSVWNSAPPLMKLLAEYTRDHQQLLPPSLKLIMLSGDWIPVTLPAEVRALESTAQIISLGGATEASIWSIYNPVDTVPADWSSIPYGKPLTNQSFHVFDDALEPRPVWVPGELYIGGIGLAQGYWRNPEKTAASFIHHPQTGERLYRTGDLGRYLPDGNIEFLGRLDFQVKVRGYRIELGEIEAALLQHPQIRATAVLAVGPNQGEKRLVAYVVPDQTGPEQTGPEQTGPEQTGPDNSEDLDRREVRQFLQQKLPEYMVPSTLIFLDQLPLTRNGKLDRRALPDPEHHHQAIVSDELVLPRNNREQQLSDIWQGILNLPAVSIHHNFFEIGGTSLQAVRLMTQIQHRLGQSLPLSTLFEGGTIAELAELLRDRSGIQPWTPLVGIQPQGTQPPFFCVHPAGGNVLCYGDLSRHLGAAQPFYGLQAPGMQAGQTPFDTVDEMATAYLAALQAVQPEGPYYLGGWSFGAIAAYEMAQQLQQQGHTVAKLVLIDTPAPLPNNPLDDATLAAWLIQDLEGQFRADSQQIEAFQQLSADQLLAALQQEAQRLQIVSAETGLDHVRRLFQVFAHHMRAIEAYQPQPYNGPAHLLRAQHQPPENPTDAALAWRELVPNIEVSQLPGNHYTLVSEPLVKNLADQLAVVLGHTVLGHS